MYRAAAILISIIPLTVTAQNEPAAGGRPDFMIEITRTPQLDIEQALRRVSLSDEDRSRFLEPTYVGLQGEDAQRFTAIGVRARAISEENARQRWRQLCDDREDLTSREELIDRLLAAAESEQIPWDEAVAEVFESFSPEALNSLIRTTATWSYARIDTDYAKYFEVADPGAVLERACPLLAAAIEDGRI